MKMSHTRYVELFHAVGPHMTGQSKRERWDALWASQYPVTELYDDGLRDAHIDTALRKIQASEGCPECGGPYKHSGNPPGCGE